MKNKNITICVVGAGFIGLPLIKRLVSLNFNLKVLDRNPCPKELIGKVDWHVGSVDDYGVLKKVLKDTSLVYHLVASTVPSDFKVDQINELNENVVSMLYFLRACIEIRVNRIIFSSSASVYGLQAALPIKEDFLTNPVSTHGINKLMIEKYLLLTEYLQDININILRIANPYGPGQKLSGRQGFIALALGNILSGKPVTVRGDGSAIRDFVFIDDVIDSFIKTGMMDLSPSILNIGSGVGISLSQVLDEFSSIMGRAINVTYESAIPSDIPSSVLDITKATREIGYSPLIQFKEGLSITCRHHGLLSKSSIN